MRYLSAATALAASLSAFGQTSIPAPTAAEFPGDAVSPPAAALQQRLAGKVVRGQPVQGPGWRFDLRGNGWVFLDLTTGPRDTGRWRAEDGRLCFEWQRFPGSGCNEVRVVGDQLLLKRTTGEIVALRE